MKKNNFIALIIVLVLAAVAVWLAVKKSGNGSNDKTDRDFAVKDTASITKMFIADKSGKKVTLTRESAGQWKVNDKFYARQDAINTLLYTVCNLEVKQPVGVKAKDNVVKILASGATKIEIYSGDDRIKMYYIGGETPDALGTYMLLADPESGENYRSPFVTYIPGFEGYLTTRYFTEPNDWRDRTVFKYIPTEIKSLKVQYPSSPKEGFEITTKGANLFDVRSLEPNATIAGFDTLAVKQYLSYYQNIQFESIEKDAKQVNKDSILATPPMCVITLVNDKGVSNTAKLYYKKAAPDREDVKGKPLIYDVDRLYAHINNGQDFVLCQYYVFGKLLQTPRYFNRQENVVKK